MESLTCPPSPPPISVGDAVVAEPKSVDNAEKYTVIFAPVVATKDEYEALFRGEQYDNYTELILREKCAFLRFSAAAVADAFVRRFDRFSFRGRPMQCEIARVVPMTGDKTIKFTGFGENAPTERDVYNAVRRFGFIRRVSVRQDCAFVDFDTINEADNFYNNSSTLLVDGIPLSVRRVTRSEAKECETFGIPLSAILPPEHPFWFRLREMIDYSK